MKPAGLLIYHLSIAAQKQEAIQKEQSLNILKKEVHALENLVYTLGKKGKLNNKMAHAFAAKILKLKKIIKEKEDKIIGL